MQHEEFLSIVKHGWNLPTQQTNKAKIIIAKFKNLRRVPICNFLILKQLLLKLVLSFLVVLEEFRDLSIQEWYFRELLLEKLVFLLHQ